MAEVSISFTPPCPLMNMNQRLHWRTGRGDTVRRELHARRRPSTLSILVPYHLRRGEPS